MTLPTVAAVGGLEEDVRSEIKDAGIDGREEERRGAIETVVALRKTTGETSRVCPVLRSEDGDFAAVDQLDAKGSARRSSISSTPTVVQSRKVIWPKLRLACRRSRFPAGPPLDQCGNLVVGIVIDCRGWLSQELQVGRR